MSTHYVFNPSGALLAGNRLRSGLSALENGRKLLMDELATMTADLDGDGSSDAHFGNVVTQYGFSNTATAHLAWSELSSALSKITSDAAQTNTDAALKQLFTRMR